MGYVLLLILVALALAVVIELWPDRDYYKYRPAYEGMHVLEQLVLQTLRDEENPLHAAEIARRTGIDSNSITTGVLQRLAQKRRVERVSPRGPWQIRRSST